MAIHSAIKSTKLPSIIAKSIIVDAADVWTGSRMGIRSIDFYKDGSLIGIVRADITGYQSDSYGTGFNAIDTFDPALSKTGSNSPNGWLKSTAGTGRIIAVFGVPIEFDTVIVNNYHASGGETTSGCKNIKINISSDAITDTTYNAAIANSTLIFDGEFDEHIASDVEDPQTLTLSIPIPMRMAKILSSVNIDGIAKAYELELKINARYVDDVIRRGTKIIRKTNIYTAKSVIVDIADNHGHSSYVGIRSIDFWYKGLKITILTSDITCYATTSESPPTWGPEKAFDVSYSKLGADENGWLSDANYTTNQRIICVFDDVQIFDKIVINNQHTSGGSTNVGAQNVVINISSDTITSTVYNEAIANSTEFFDGTLDEHVASNIEDPEILELSEIPAKLNLKSVKIISSNELESLNKAQTNIKIQSRLDARVVKRASNPIKNKQYVTIG